MSEIILKLLIAVVVGGLIGSERELRVGFGLRTLMLICLGATMFTIYSSYFAFGEGDQRRIAAAVVSGVGFLGAGMILRHEGSVLGLTTAAASWLVAALGMGIGLGYYQPVAVATILVLIILWAIPRIQQITQSRQTTTYQITTSLEERVHDRLWKTLEENGLAVISGPIEKVEERFTYVFRVSGKPDQHQAAMLSFVDDPEVQEFRVL
jgi:putative Mg2+ transporter-C (MgtC) family protein